jgi:hypothetical protein
MEISFRNEGKSKTFSQLGDKENLSWADWLQRMTEIISLNRKEIIKEGTMKHQERRKKYKKWKYE